MSLIIIYGGFTLIILTRIIIFYRKVRTYPTGPLPLPVVGNLLKLIWRKTHPFITICESCRSYGKVTTFWFGSKPAVIINDLDVAKKVFNQISASGRPQISLVLIVNGETFNGFGAQDYSIAVKYFRKLSIDAIRQTLSSNKLSSLIYENISQTVDIIKSSENNKPFSLQLYWPQILFRIIAELIYGQKYSFADKQLISIEHALEMYNKEIMKLSLIDIFPVSKYFLRVNSKYESESGKIAEFHETSFQNCKNTYKIGNCDSISTSLLTARIKMLEENSENSKYLTDSDLKGVLSTLFFGGIDSSIQTFNWTILLLAHYTEIQQKLRKEINDKIGNDICPQLEDRRKCHYFNAFIHETLRFLVLSPLSFPHRTISDTTISTYKIPKDTIIMIDQYTILNNPLYWKEPKKFLPERFLDSSGTFISNRFPAFIPFGTGKRMCVGERMAVEMLFLELVCLLQSTNGYQIELPNGPQNDDLDITSHLSICPEPKAYNIVLKNL